VSAAQDNHPGARRPERGLDRESAQQSGQRGQRPGRPATRPPAGHPKLLIKERLLSAWLGDKRLTELSLPRRFPIVQFPSLPLIVAFLASAAGKFLNGSAHSYAASASCLDCARLARRHHAHQPAHLCRRFAPEPRLRAAGHTRCSCRAVRRRRQLFGYPLPVAPGTGHHLPFRCRTPHARGQRLREARIEQAPFIRGTSATSGVAESVGMPTWPTLIVRACSRWRGAGCACR